ncbi:hypothetical protein ACFC18_53750, partial [Streptomyces sp. NPDC056121]|uniref:hypothetical protein n=1 Tax=Streptomyces sp. NPDC056121 TaxID=3345718 RepID=UPI0035E26CC9
MDTVVEAGLRSVKKSAVRNRVRMAHRPEASRFPLVTVEASVSRGVGRPDDAVAGARCQAEAGLG